MTAVPSPIELGLYEKMTMESLEGSLKNMVEKVKKYPDKTNWAGLNVMLTAYEKKQEAAK